MADLYDVTRTDRELIQATSSQPPGDSPGKVLNRKYELLERVGQGGMAVVWRAATHGAHGFRRIAAIKRIHTDYVGFKEIEEMFVEEARVGAALRHQNIVQIQDFGVDEMGRHYLVTEWVEGLHFGDWVRSFQVAREQTPWPFVAAIALDVLRALAAAHSRCDPQGNPAPILHRDVTPPNILLDVTGVTKLADFGMARAMDRGRMTRPDMIKGKLSYLAPEMVLGQPPSVQSDLFALGVVMWEALAGERLFDAPTDVEVVRMVRDARVPLLSMKRPGLPMRLTTTVHRALERAPERRPAAAQDMLRDLNEVIRVLPRPPDTEALAASAVAARQRLKSSAG
jgi:serine/threonine-protein kinase